MPRRASTQVKEKNSCRWWEHTWTASVCRTDATFSELLSWSDSVLLLPLEPAGTSPPSDGQLGGQLEVLRPVTVRRDRDSILVRLPPPVKVDDFKVEEKPIPGGPWPACGGRPGPGR